MKRLLLIFGYMVMAGGCVTHYCQVQGDRLALYLDQPDAQRVLLASSLDGFEPHEARKVDGRWVVSLPADRQFRYYYVLDGELFVPSCLLKETDDFGSENCIYDPQL
jgi:hypothetical protein